MSATLKPVIHVDEDKCVNCHRCIAVCPVKYCIDGSGDKVKVLHELCIGCGSCIEACTHGAREGIDDFDEFMAALGRRERMIAVVAPAVAARFPDDYLRLNGWLKGRGVEAVFDVAFGAELTVRSYLEHIKKNSPKLVIAQPCPAIVSYVEIFQPELLPHLAPADSPMLHAIKMAREYRPELATRKIAVISPCVAKRREFDETGLGDFNVTLQSIVKYFEDSKIDLHSFPEAEFDNPPAERAVLFSAPGGLKETVERELPGAGSRVRKIEGPEEIYPYLKGLPEVIKRGLNPLIVDCLNCSKGCNGGTGTGSQDIPVDILESGVRRRDERQRRLLKKRGLFRGAGTRALHASIERHWKQGLYARSYVNRSRSFVLVQPTEAQLAAIYARMHKTSEEDYLDCSACGYFSCEGMAVAVHNNLNKPENCQHYRQKVLLEKKSEIAELAFSLNRELSVSADMIARVIAMLPELNRLRDEQATSLEESKTRIKALIGKLANSAASSAQRESELSVLLATAAEVQRELSGSLDSIAALREKMKRVADLVVDIDAVANHTNLLSMNASIEAAHAGASGKGFGVVASEIRSLAEKAGKSAAQIGQSLSVMSKDMDKTASASERSGSDIKGLLGHLDVLGGGMRGIFGALDAMSADTGGIDEALDGLFRAVGGVRETYLRLESSLTDAASEIAALASSSKEKVRKLEEL